MRVLSFEIKAIKIVLFTAGRGLSGFISFRKWFYSKARVLIFP